MSNFLKNFGKPIVCISDNGTEFRKRLRKKVYRRQTMRFWSTLDTLAIVKVRSPAGIGMRRCSSRINAQLNGSIGRKGKNRSAHKNAREWKKKRVIWMRGNRARKRARIQAVLCVYGIGVNSYGAENVVNGVSESVGTQPRARPYLTGSRYNPARAPIRLRKYQSNANKKPHPQIITLHKLSTFLFFFFARNKFKLNGLK